MNGTLCGSVYLIGLKKAGFLGLRAFSLVD